LCPPIKRQKTEEFRTGDEFSLQIDYCASLFDEMFFEEFRNKECMQETPQKLRLLSLKEEFVTLKKKVTTLFF
jgi:hypothetical protein